MEDWFYAQGRDRSGPVSREQLLDFIRTGIVTPGSLVWTRSMDSWQPAIQVPGLLTPVGTAEVPGPSPEALVSPPISAPGSGPGPQPGEPTPFDTNEPAVQTAAEIETPSPTTAAPAGPAVAGAEPEHPWEPEGGSRAATGTLSFNGKRPTPQHKRAGTRIKALIARAVAILIAVGIMGTGSYLGAQYLGLFGPDLSPRLRYLPDDPDFFVTINLPKLMTVAQSIDPTAGQMPMNLQASGLPISPDAIQDVTVAGNIGEKRWVVIATLATELDAAKLFPGGTKPDTTKAGGTKIYYSREMADFGVDFAIAMPSKTTMLVGPLATLRKILKRRQAPRVSPAFQSILESTDSTTWFAGAADVQSLWKLVGDLPVELDEKQRWLMESIDSASFSLRGSGEYLFEMVAHCRQAKDAGLIAGEVRKAMQEQREQLLEVLVRQTGQSVDAGTLDMLNSMVVEPDAAAGTITLKQRVTREMLEESAPLLTASGALTQP